MNLRMVEEFTNNEELRELLYQFFSNSGWQGAKLKLSRLKKMAKDEQEQIEIVKQSIERGWKAFYQKSPIE